MTEVDTQDPMVLLAEQVKRQAAVDALDARVRKAKAALWMDWKKADATFWAALAIRLDWKPVWTVDTACTDGKSVYTNPQFFADCNDAEAVGLVVHETGHPALQHLARMKEARMEPKRANEAADLVLNPLLVSAGFTLPKCRIMPGEGRYKKLPPGMSFEQVYRWLEENCPDDGTDADGAGNDPGQCGGFMQPGHGTDAEIQEQKSKWEVAVAQAHNAAKMRGELSAGLERMVQEILNPKVDCWEVIREFLHKTVSSNDYEWLPPNRRFVWQDMYLPSRKSAGGGELVVMCDLSGSISNDDMRLFAECVEGLGEVYPALHVTVLYHDSEVTHTQEWTPAEGSFVMEPKGGGGTSHVPCFNWIAEHDIEVDCCVALTDLCSQFPDHPPRYPMLWATTVKGSKGPWGMTVEIN